MAYSLVDIRDNSNVLGSRQPDGKIIILESILINIKITTVYPQKIIKRGNTNQFP